MSNQEAQIPQPAPEPVIKTYDDEKLKPETESKAHLLEGEIFSTPPSAAGLISEVLKIPAAISQVSVNPKQDQIVIDYQNETKTKLEEEVEVERSLGASAEKASHEDIVDIGSVTSEVGIHDLTAKNDSETGTENSEDQSRVIVEKETIQLSELENAKEKAVHLPNQKGEDKEDENAVNRTIDDHLVSNEESIITKSEPENEVKEQEETSIQDAGDKGTHESTHQETKAGTEVQSLPEAEEIKLRDKVAEETENASAESTEAIHDKEVVEVVQPTEEKLPIKQEDQDIEDKDRHSPVEEVISEDYIEGHIHKEQHTSRYEAAREEETVIDQIDDDLTREEAKIGNPVEEKKLVEQNEDVEAQTGSPAHQPIEETPDKKVLSEVVEENVETKQIEEDDEESKGYSEVIAAVASHTNSELQKEDTEQGHGEDESTFESKKEDYEVVDQAQISSEVEETKPEQKVQEAAEVETEKNIVDIVTHPENANVTEPEEFKVLNEKLKEKEDVQIQDADSCVDDETTESSVKDDPKQEQGVSTEEKFEVKKDDVTEKFKKEDDGKFDDYRKQEQEKCEEFADDSQVAEQVEKVADHEDEEVKQLDSSKEPSINDRNTVSDAENTEIIDKHVEQIPEDIHELHKLAISHADEEPVIEKAAVSKIIESQPEEEKSLGEQTSHQAEGEIESTNFSSVQAHEEAEETQEEVGGIEAETETDSLNEKIKEKEEAQNKDVSSVVEQATAERPNPDQDTTIEERSVVKKEDENQEVGGIETEEETEALNEKATAETCANPNPDQGTTIEEKSEIQKEDETEKLEKENDDIKQDEKKPEEIVDPEVAEEVEKVPDHEDDGETQFDSSKEQSSNERNVAPEGEDTEIIDKHEIEQIPEDLHELHESVISHANAGLEIESEAVNDIIESRQEEEETTGEETIPKREVEVESTEASIAHVYELSKSEEVGGVETEKVQAKAIPQTDEAVLEKEAADIGISYEKVKKGEEVLEYEDLHSSKEEGSAGSFQKDGIKQEQDTSTEDKYETTKIVEHPSSLESELVEGNTPAEEKEKITEEAATTPYSEQLHGFDHASVQTESEDTLEKIETEEETGNKAVEEFEKTHEPVIQQYESTTHTQNLENVEETKAEENPEAEAEAKAEQLVEEYKSPSDETAHGKEALEVEIPRKKDDEVRHEDVHSHVEEVVKKRSIEDAVKQEEETVIGRKFETTKTDETENINKEDESVSEDGTEKAPASIVEVDESTIKENYAEESEDSGLIESEKVASALGSKEILALSQEPTQLEHEDSSEKHEQAGEKVEDEKSYHISGLEEAVTPETSQHENLIEEENKSEENYKVTEEAIEIEKNPRDLTVADDNLAEPINESSHQNEHEKSIEIVAAAESQVLEHEHLKTEGVDLREEVENKDEDEKNANKISDDTELKSTEDASETEKVAEKIEEALETLTPAIASEEARASDEATYIGNEDSLQKIEKENEEEKNGGETVTASNPVDTINKDQDATAEEKLEAIVETNEVEKVLESPDSAHEQLTEQPREILGTIEQNDGTKHEEATRTETVTTEFEEAYLPDNAVIDREKDPVQKNDKEGETEKESEEVLVKEENPAEKLSEEQDEAAEEKHEAIIEASEIEKVLQKVETVDQKVTEQLKEELEETKPIDENIFQKKEEEKVETVTPVFDGEEAQGSDHTVTNTEIEDSRERLSKGLEWADQATTIQQPTEHSRETEPIDKSIDQVFEHKDIQQLNEIPSSTELTDESIGQKEKEESIEKAEHELENVEAPGFDQPYTVVESVASTQEIENKNEDTKSSHLESKVKTGHEEIDSEKLLDAKVDAKEAELKSEDAGGIDQLVASVVSSEGTQGSDHLYTKPESVSDAKIQEVAQQNAHEFIGHPGENPEPNETTDKSIIQEENEGIAEKIITVVDYKGAHASDQEYSKPESEVNSSSTEISEDEAIVAGVNPIQNASVEELSREAREQQVSRTPIQEQDEDHKGTEFTEKPEINDEQKDDSKDTSAVSTENLESGPREVIADPIITTLSRDTQDSFVPSTLQDEYVILEAADHAKAEGAPSKKEEATHEETEETQTKQSLSLSNLFQASVRRTNQEDPVTEKTDTKAEEGAEVEQEEEHEHVEDSGDGDSKAQPKKHPHNLLSGVGSKVKHSLDKVKKAITGKSKPK